MNKEQFKMMVKMVEAENMRKARDALQALTKEQVAELMKEFSEQEGQSNAAD